MKIKVKQEKVLRTLLDPKDFVGCGDGIWTTWPSGYENSKSVYFSLVTTRKRRIFLDFFADQMPTISPTKFPAAD